MCPAGGIRDNNLCRKEFTCYKNEILVILSEPNTICSLYITYSYIHMHIYI